MLAAGLCRSNELLGVKRRKPNRSSTSLEAYDGTLNHFTMSSVMKKSGDVIGENYCLDQPLGKNQAKRVWRALNTKTDLPVAIELVEPDDKRVNALIERLKLFKEVEHANVVKVLDVGRTADGWGYAALELVKGSPLDTRLTAKPTFGLSDLVLIMSQALEGLAALHLAGLVHGDINPETIILEAGMGRPMPKLVGFGLSRAAQRAGQEDARFDDPGFLRSLAYASPEQAGRKLTINAKSDIYSVGVVLFEAISGLLPLRGGSENELREAILEGPDSTLIAVCDDIPLPLSRAVQRALATSPDDRHKSASSMKDALLSSLLIAPEELKKKLLPVVSRAGGQGDGGDGAEASEQADEDAPEEQEASLTINAAEETEPEQKPEKKPDPKPEPATGSKTDSSQQQEEATQQLRGEELLEVSELFKEPQKKVRKQPPSVPKAGPSKDSRESTEDRPSKDPGESTQELGEEELLDVLDEPAKAALRAIIPPPPPIPPPDRFEVPSDRNGADDKPALTTRAALDDALEAAEKGTVKEKAAEEEEPKEKADQEKKPQDKAGQEEEPEEEELREKTDLEEEADQEEADQEEEPEEEADQEKKPSAKAAPDSKTKGESHRAVEGETGVSESSAEEDDDAIAMATFIKSNQRPTIWIAGAIIVVVVIIVGVFIGFGGNDRSRDDGQQSIASATPPQPAVSTEASVDAGSSTSQDDASGTASALDAAVDGGAQSIDSDIGELSDADASDEEAGPSTFEITLRGVPDGAQFRLDGTTTSGPVIEVPADGRTHVLSVIAEEHRSWHQRLNPTEDTVIDVQMSPRSSASTATKRPGGGRGRGRIKRPSLVRDPGF